MRVDSRSVLSAVGELRHSGAKVAPLEGAVGVALGEMFAGSYAIGTCDFDLSSKLAAEYAVRDEPSRDLAKMDGAPELVIRVSGGIEITVTPASADAVSGVDVR